MKKKRDSFLIIETRTGFIDGYWLDFKTALLQCEGMKRTFPRGLFIVATVSYKAQENIMLEADRATGAQGFNMLQVFYGISDADTE